MVRANTARRGNVKGSDDTGTSGDKFRQKSANSRKSEPPEVKTPRSAEICRKFLAGRCRGQHRCRRIHLASEECQEDDLCAPCELPSHPQSSVILDVPTVDGDTGVKQGSTKRHPRKKRTRRNSPPLASIPQVHVVPTSSGSSSLSSSSSDSDRSASPDPFPPTPTTSTDSTWAYLGWQDEFSEDDQQDEPQFPLLTSHQRFCPDHDPSDCASAGGFGTDIIPMPASDSEFVVRIPYQNSLSSPVASVPPIESGRSTPPRMAAAQTAPRRFGTKPKEICRDYARGRCWRGAECCYWHDDEQPVENVSNTSPAVEILSDKRFQPLKFSNEFSDSNNHPRSGDAGLERDDNPEDALDFTPEQLPRSVCWAWLRGGCSRGDACKYPHGNYRQPAATPQDRPMSCQHDFGETSKPTFRGSIDANSNERELALRPHKRCASLTITQFGARVTYGDGLAVNRVQIEHESCTRVVLSNIPTSISRTDFFAAVKLFGHVLDVDFKDDLSMKRDSMLAYVAYTHHARAVQAMSALDGSAMFGRVLSAQIPSGVSIGQGLIHDSTVVLSWDAPKLIGYAGYATQEEADNIIVATNDQELDGRIMKSYIHTGLPSLGVCTVRLENIPRQSVMTKRKFIGKTEGFMIEKPKYALHVAVREVRAFVERSIPQADLLAFDMDMSPDRHGIVRATITCSSAAAAHSLADIMSGRKFKSLGNVSIISHHMHSVSFRIPKATYNILYDDLCSLESDLVGAGGNVRVLNQEGEAPETTIELIAPGLPIFRVYRSRVEQLLRGEVVHKDGATVWDDFFLYPTCHRFLGFLRHQQPSVLLQRDKHHRLIKLFGPSAGRKVIADYIIAKVEHLQGQSRHTFPLSGRLIGLFFSSDLRRLQHALGQENVNLDRVRKVLHVRGGSTAYGLARDIIDHAERRYPLRMRTEKTSCSVCFGPTENAVVLACGHRYCRSCVHGYLTSASVQSWPLTCLGDDAKCQREIPLRLMQQLLNPREFEDATRRSFLAYIRSHPDELQFCPTPDCPEVYRPGPKNTTRQCPTCLNRICTYCRTECHDNMRCEERAQHQEPLFKEWVAAHDVKPCPRCSAHIERVAGCNHITCAACRTHICWVCLKTFPDDREIYGHMREAHGGIGLEEM